MSHSPLPWGVNSLGEIISSDGCFVAAVALEYDTTEDDANLIVNAVNHHDKLVEALSRLCEWEALNGGFESPCWDEARKVLNAIRDERETEV